MDKKLPSMYQSDIKKEIKNSMNSYYSKNNYAKKSNNTLNTKEKQVEKKYNSDTKYVISVRKKIYNIFKACKYEFVIDTKIEYNDGVVEERKIIGQDSKNIITFDREKIRIDDIKDIYMI